tara:strand:- start:1953 stop:2234 length:282 start_codon:yes stop_codon:yes gene_type:complete
MAFVETPNAFLADFGKTCQIGGGSTFKGILESPADVIAGGVAVTREYLLIAKTSDVSSASRGTAITVDSVNYTVRENLPVDDATFSELLLSKV